MQKEQLENKQDLTKERWVMPEVDLLPLDQTAGGPEVLDESNDGTVIS